MHKDGMGRLESLLFTGDRELLNLKFFASSDAANEDELASAAHDALRFALQTDGPDDVPQCLGRRGKLSELLALN